jgi:hypothetical protein
MVFDAARVVGDLEAGDLDVAGIGQVEDERRAFHTPQLRGVRAASVPTRSQDARGIGRIRPAGDRWHITVPGIVGLAVLGSGCAVAHPVTARGDGQRIAASDAQRATRRERAERVVPGTGLARPAAGVRSVYPPSTLAGRASIGADIVASSAHWLNGCHDVGR